jgi:hypothetical protein
MIQLPQVPTVQDLHDLLSHPLANPRDAAGLLGEEVAEVRKRVRRWESQGNSFSKCLPKNQPGNCVPV